VQGFSGSRSGLAGRARMKNWYKIAEDRALTCVYDELLLWAAAGVLAWTEDSWLRSDDLLSTSN